MPVGSTEITPQTPSGIAKISVEVGDIIAETSFGAELDLLTDQPVEMPAESLDFTQVGQVLRKMMPLEVQIEGEAVERPSIDVELPVDKPAITEAAPRDLPQQIRAAEIMMPAKILPTEKTDREPKTAEVIPLEPDTYVQIPRPTSVSSVAGKPSIPEIPFAPNVQIKAQLAEKSGDPTSDKNPDIKQAIAQPQNNVPHDAKPAPPNVVSATLPDTANGKLPEPKLQTAPEFHRDGGDFGTSISAPLLAQRPLLTTHPVAPPAANRSEAGETKILAQISTAISNTSKNTVEIRLDPPELGRVIITITQSDSGLLATVTSEKAEIADLLRRHAEILSRELSKSGFNDATLEFSHRDQKQKHPAFDRGNAPFLSTALENNEVAATIETILLPQSGSLDIRL